MVTIQLDKVQLLAIKKGGKIRDLLSKVRYYKSLKLISENELIIHSELTDKQYLDQKKIHDLFFTCPITGIRGYLINNNNNEDTSTKYKNEFEVDTINKKEKNGINFININIKQI